ncbi:GLUG motif-containing protein [Natronospora cellulosivora (SeqCode)]
MKLWLSWLYANNPTPKESYIVDGENNVGGLVGENSRNISYSYSTGSVNGENNVGGLVGYNRYNSPIINSYYDEYTTNQNDTGKGEPKTTEDMMQEATFDGWDFENVWMIEEDSYPQLRN